MTDAKKDLTDQIGELKKILVELLALLRDEK